MEFKNKCVAGQEVGTENSQPPQPRVLVRTMPESQTIENRSTNDLRVLRALPETSAGNGAERPAEPLVDEKVLRVTVGICLKGHTPPESYHDRMMMMLTLGRMEADQFYRKENPRVIFNYFSAGEIFVPYAREQLCQVALDYNSDFVFMIDDDMIAPPDLVYQLLKHDKDVVAALAFTRNPPHQPVIYQTIEGFDPVMKVKYGKNTTVKNYPRNTLVECDAVGFGAVLIRCSLLKKMNKPWFMGCPGAGEDITFCYNAKHAGAHIFMDTSAKLGHLSHPLVVTEDYSDNFNKMTLEEKEKVYGCFMKYGESK